ncbi:MAG TPA: hypothetical protein VGG75_13635 [Trebonia sp.]|jgi:hypothetical protein
MIVEIRKSCLERMTRWYHVTRAKLDVGLHKFVKSEEEEAVKMQRRLHIHMCLLGCSGLISFVGGPILGADVVGGVSFTTLAVQEFLDYVGRF